MKAFKLVRVRANGTLGPLFINRRQVLPVGVWLQAENHPTKGFAVRPGWHVTAAPVAPHLSKRGRGWITVEVEDYIEVFRPKSQGGLWFLAQRMKVMPSVLLCELHGALEGS